MPQLQPHQKAAFAQAGVPDQHHDQLHALGVQPQQAQQMAAAGFDWSRLSQLLPLILQFIAQIAPLFGGGQPQAAPQQPAQQPPAQPRL